jgi:hypothetical protein
MAKKSRATGRGPTGVGRKAGGSPMSKTEIGIAGPLIKQAEDARNSRIKAMRSYRAWEKAIEVVEDVYAEYQMIKSAEHQRPAEMAECQERLMKSIKVVLPYEKPKLQVVKLQGDRNAPLFDLSSLSDKDLQFLRRTVLKAQEVPEEEQ